MEHLENLEIPFSLPLAIAATTTTTSRIWDSHSLPASKTTKTYSRVTQHNNCSSLSSHTS